MIKVKHVFTAVVKTWADQAVTTEGTTHHIKRAAAAAASNAAAAAVFVKVTPAAVAALNQQVMTF